MARRQAHKTTRVMQRSHNGGGINTAVSQRLRRKGSEDQGSDVIDSFGAERCPLIEIWNSVSSISQQRTILQRDRWRLLRAMVGNAKR